MSSVLVSPEAAASIVHLSKQTLAALRVKGGGRGFVRIGKRWIAYSMEALEKFIAERTFKSTSEYP